MASEIIITLPDFDSISQLSFFEDQICSRCHQWGDGKICPHCCEPICSQCDIFTSECTQCYFGV